MSVTMSMRAPVSMTKGMESVPCGVCWYYFGIQFRHGQQCCRVRYSDVRNCFWSSVRTFENQVGLHADVYVTCSAFRKQYVDNCDTPLGDIFYSAKCGKQMKLVVFEAAKSQETAFDRGWNARKAMKMLLGLFGGVNESNHKSCV